MTGGGDLDETAHDDLLDEAGIADEFGDVPDDEDAADGLAGVPVSAPSLELNENDPDPTAGASDIGGLPGGLDADADDEGGQGRTGAGTGPSGT
jgi:hypothetical protein